MLFLNTIFFYFFFRLKLDEMTSRPFGMPLKLGGGDEDDEEPPIEDARGARKKKF